MLRADVVALSYGLFHCQPKEGKEVEVASCSAKSCWPLADSTGSSCDRPMMPTVMWPTDCTELTSDFTTAALSSDGTTPGKASARALAVCAQSA